MTHLRQGDIVVAMGHRSNNNTTVKSMASILMSQNMDMNKYYVDMPIYGTVDRYTHKADPIVNYDAIAPFEEVMVMHRPGAGMTDYVKGVWRHGRDWIYKASAPYERFTHNAYWAKQKVTYNKVGLRRTHRTVAEDNGAIDYVVYTATEV